MLVQEVTVKRSLFVVAVVLLCMFCFVAGSTYSYAAERQGNIKERIEVLQGRIDQGIRSGALTRGEAARVQRELDGVREERARILREQDGQISHPQRERLNRRLDEIARLIHREKLDTQRRD